jgi:hypothetical protein
MPLSDQPRIFISYAHKDGKDLAQRLHRDLTDEGFVVWLDTQRLTGGDIWRQEIAEAIDRAAVVVALLSSASYISDVCRVEQQRALEKRKPIIPIHVQSDCEIPDYLNDLQRLDFATPTGISHCCPRLGRASTNRPVSLCPPFQ